jgi:hypothetical protein
MSAKKDGPKMEEVTGGCRRLCYEELHNLFALLNIRRLKRAGHVACMERNA